MALAIIIRTYSNPKKKLKNQWNPKFKRICYSFKTEQKENLINFPHFFFSTTAKCILLNYVCYILGKTKFIFRCICEMTKNHVQVKSHKNMWVGTIKIKTLWISNKNLMNFKAFFHGLFDHLLWLNKISYLSKPSAGIEC